MLWIILLALLVILAVGALPSWPYSNSGYYPSSILATVLLVVVILWLVGAITVTS